MEICEVAFNNFEHSLGIAFLLIHYWHVYSLIYTFTRIRTNATVLDHAPPTTNRIYYSWHLLDCAQVD